MFNESSNKNPGVGQYDPVKVKALSYNWYRSQKDHPPTI